MGKNVQTLAKRAANAEYAARFPSRDRMAKKKERSRRVAARQAAWCERNLS